MIRAYFSLYHNGQNQGYFQTSNNFKMHFVKYLRRWQKFKKSNFSAEMMNTDSLQS